MITKPSRNTPKTTTCSYCGEDLPESEIKKGAVNHISCWKFAVHTKRAWSGSKGPTSVGGVYDLQ